MAVYTTINDPSAQFQTALYTGTGSSQSIVNDGNANLQPDLVWGKVRSTTNNHVLVNSAPNGITKYLIPNGTNSLATDASVLTALNSDGFTGGGTGILNGSGNTYVAWQWKINGGTTSSVGVGSITTTVQANTTAGVSIARYTGNGVNGATIGHGLGKTPTMVWVKGEEGAESWQIYNVSLGPTKYDELDSDSVPGTNANRWSNTAPTSSIINLGNGNSVNYSGRVFLAFSFAPIQGFSQFGSYRGNGNADGPFVYTGFKPAWLMIKNTASTWDWQILDDKRNPFNSNSPIYLAPNTTGADNTGSDAPIDFLSNGFKVRTSSALRNGSGNEVTYAVFASSPFVTSDGVPTTAR